MKTKISYLKSVTGEKIVEEYDIINSSTLMRATATQIFPVMNGLYDAFIYYQVYGEEEKKGKALL